MFSDALLAADTYYYKSELRKKKQNDKEKHLTNIKKFLVHKEAEKRQKQLDAQKKREEFVAMHDLKTLRRIQKTVIKSSNNSVIEDAEDKNSSAVTPDGPDQPDQDNYGCVSQEGSAFYEKIIEKCSNLSEKPKFPTKSNAAIKDLKSSKETVKNILYHEDVSVSHKRRRGEYDRLDNEEDVSSQQKYEPYEKVRDKKPEKPKEKKRITPQMDFYQLLTLAEKNKSERVDIAAKKQVMEPELHRVMTKKQNIEYDEEMALRKQRQKIKSENDKKFELNVIHRVRKLSGKYHVKQLHDQVKSNEKEKNRSVLDREKATERGEFNLLKYERKKEKKDMESIEKHKSESESIDRYVGRLNRDRYILDKTNFNLESKIDNLKIKERNNEEKKNVDVKSQNTYRRDKCQSEMKCSTASNIGDRKQIKVHISHGKSVCKELLQRNYSEEKLSKINQNMHMGPESLKNNGMDKSDSAKESQGSKEIPLIRFEDNKLKAKSFARSSQPKIINRFNFDEYVSSIKRKSNPDDLKKKKRHIFDSESDVDDCIDQEKEDYSRYIKKIFGYNKLKYKGADNDDDHKRKLSYAQQQREKYTSKKIDIMEDLKKMRREPMEKKKSKKRRISDD